MKINYDINRIRWLDFARGIGILLVLLGHILPKSNIISIIIYSFHIPLFFIISGYLLGQKTFSELKYSNFIRKRLYNLLYKYYTLSITMMIVQLIICIIFNDKITLVSDLINIIILNGFYATWFLPCIFFSEQIFILFYISKYRYVMIFVALFIIAILLIISKILISYALISKIFTKILSIIIRILFGSLFILIGFYSKKVIDKKSLKLLIFSIFILIINFVSCRFNGEVDLYYNIFNNILLYLYFSIVTSICIMYIFSYFNAYNIFVNYFGVNTIIIMSTHLPFIWLLRKVEFLKYCYFIQFLLVLIIEYIIINLIKKYFSIILDYKKIKNLVKKCQTSKKCNF